jgi:uncharacterized protein (TIGR02186 family)
VRSFAVAVAALILAATCAANAQTPAPAAESQPVVPAAEGPAAASGEVTQGERIEIGLSTETVAITADFSGADLTIFGAVDNVDPLVQRQSRYDVFVILEGPTADMMARRKGRVFGIWMNVDSQKFDGVPQSYLIASTRPSQDIADAETLARLSLNIGDIRLRPDQTSGNSAADVQTFADALRGLREKAELYQEFPSGVRFISQSLFRARLRLPASVPLGHHIARAYLFRQGALVAQTQASLDIRKAGLEYQLYRFAQNQAFLYGLTAVALAFLVGWLARVLMRKD